MGNTYRSFPELGKLEKFRLHFLPDKLTMDQIATVVMLATALFGTVAWNVLVDRINDENMPIVAYFGWSVYVVTVVAATLSFTAALLWTCRPRNNSRRSKAKGSEDVEFEYLRVGVPATSDTASYSSHDYNISRNVDIELLPRTYQQQHTGSKANRDDEVELLPRTGNTQHHTSM